MKIYTTNIKESWIIDRIKKEWMSNFSNYVANMAIYSDVIWVIAPWAISNKFIKRYKNKKIIYSVYHIENQSQDGLELSEIKFIDQYVSAYHVISIQTKQILEKITTKPIYFIPLWVNQNIWYHIEDKITLRNKYGFKKSDFLIGSFQRDTEGSDLLSPKLVKGPDIFVKILEMLYKDNKKITAVLTGKRRGYVISELERLSIPYKYFEMPSFSMMNELYNLLDLYLITSRLEGGPQALVECGQTKTPIISTDVGLSRQILSSKSIFEYKDLNTFFSAEPDTEYAYSTSSKLTIPDGMFPYLEMFKSTYEN